MVEESYCKLCSLSTLVWSTSHLPSLSRIGYFHSTLRTFGHKITRIQCYGWTIIKHFPYTYLTRCYYFSLRRNRFGIFGNLDRCLFSFHDFEIEVQNSAVQIGEGRLACDYFSFRFWISLGQLCHSQRILEFQRRLLHWSRYWRDATRRVSFHVDYSLSGTSNLWNRNEKKLPLTPFLCHIHCPKCGKIITHVP